MTTLGAPSGGRSGLIGGNFASRASSGTLPGILVLRIRNRQLSAIDLLRGRRSDPRAQQQAQCGSKNQNNFLTFSIRSSLASLRATSD